MLRNRKNFLYVCAFFFSLAGSILGLSLIYRLADRFLFTPAKIGAFVALGQLFYFLGCNAYQYFGSRFDPAKVFNVTSIIVFLSSIPLGFTRTPVLAYAAFWILQFSTGLFWPPIMAWLTGGLSMEELNRKIGIYNRSWVAGNILGPLISGALYQWKSGLDFIVLGACYFLVIPLLRIMQQNSRRSSVAAASPASPAGVTNPEDAVNTGHAEAANTANPKAAIAADKKLDLYRYRGWISALSSTVFMGVLANVFPLHVRDGLGYSERSAGFILFLRSIAGFAGFAILARFTAWHFNRRWMMILQYGLLLCTLFLMFAGSRLYFYAFVVIIYGFINAACYNNSMFHSGATGKNIKKNLALHEIFMCIGAAAGTVLGGYFYQHFRFTGTCIVLFLAISAGLGILIFLDRREARINSALF